MNRPLDWQDRVVITGCALALLAVSIITFWS